MLQVGFSQKISRAYNALSEMKYPRALELFGEVLEKDPNSVPALFGYAKTTMESFEKLNLTSGESELEKSMNYLTQAEALYPGMNKDDQQLLIKELTVFTTADITSLRIKLSDFLWDKHYTTRVNIDSVERYATNFSFGNKSAVVVREKLAFLYYQKVMSLNTISDFKFYLSKFPDAKETPAAKKALENLELDLALQNPQIDTLEFYIKKYPLTERASILQEKLADLYINTINENASESSIKQVKNKILQLDKIKQSKYLDLCAFYLIKKEYNSLLASDNISQITVFLKKHAALKGLDLKPLALHKNELIYKKLISDAEINYPLYLQYIREVKIENPGMNALLNRVKEDLINKSVSAYKKYVNAYINDNFNVSTDRLQAVSDFVDKNLYTGASFGTDTLYRVSKSVTETNQNQIIKRLIESLGLFNSFISKEFYLMPNDSYWDIIHLVRVSSDNKIKRSFYVFGEMNQYVLIPEIKTNAPIYTAIKQRYSIVSFSTPKIYSKNGDAYQVVLYGYLTGDQPCCPGYEMNINYKYDKGQLTPLLANYVNRRSGSIEQESINSYYRIGLNFLESEFEKFIEEVADFDEVQISGNDSRKHSSSRDERVDVEKENPTNAYQHVETSGYKEPVFLHPSSEAQFNGDWKSYVQRTIERSLDDLIDDGQEGTCKIIFIVAEDGTISNVEALTMQGSVLARIGVDAIKKGPKWIPGKNQYGQPVASKRIQTVSFMLPDE